MHSNFGAQIVFFCSLSSALKMKIIIIYGSHNLDFDNEYIDNFRNHHNETNRKTHICAFFICGLPFYGHNTFSSDWIVYHGVKLKFNPNKNSFIFVPICCRI